MKKILKVFLFGGILLLAMGAVNSDTAMADNENNGVEVIIYDLTGEMVLRINCGDGWVDYYAKSGKAQIKDGEYHLYKYVIQLPKDNCYVPSPEEGAYSFEIWGGTMLFNPSGKCIFKYIANPQPE